MNTSNSMWIWIQLTITIPTRTLSLLGAWVYSENINYAFVIQVLLCKVENSIVIRLFFFLTADSFSREKHVNLPFFFEMFIYDTVIKKE